ncbi:restriction endonuclease subunit S [Staphylococcus hominis]
MTEHIKTPELRFSNFLDMWHIHKLSDVATITGGGTPSTKVAEYWNGEIDWYTPNEIGERIYAKGSKKKITNLGYKKSSTKLLPVNTILFTSRAGIGNTAILAKEGCTNQGFQSIIPNSEKIDSYFIYTISNHIKKYALKHAAGSTFLEISGKELGKMKLFLPSLKEQQKIGVFFSKLDRQIELEEEKLELLEQQKKGYMQKLFSQELKFRDKNGNDFPEWQLKNLSELGETFTGLSGKTKDDFGYGDGLFITYMNVFKNTIAKSDMVERVKIEANENQNKVQYGDILFTTSSEVPNEVGMSSIWLFNQDNVYLNSFCFGFRVVVNYIKPVYLARYLRSEEMRKTITILAQGSTRFNISKKEMMKLNIKVPYIEEQIKIDNFFNKIDTLILKQGKKIELLKQRKQGLLQKMFV